MKTPHPLFLRSALAVLAFTLPCCAFAADVLVWSAGAVQAPMTDLVQEFQRGSADTVKIEYAPVGTLVKRLSEGGHPDVLVLSRDVQPQAERAAWAVHGSSRALGHVGIGVAVREGAPQPDISTVEAFKAALLNAKSITYIDPGKGTSGKHLAGVLEQLGIADAVKPKTRLGEAGYVVEPVAHGEVEIGMQQITEILPVQGVKLVGPLPAELQKITTYVISQGMSAQNPEGAREFMAFVLKEASLKHFVAKGFTAP